MRHQPLSPSDAAPEVAAPEHVSQPARVPAGPFAPGGLPHEGRSFLSSQRQAGDPVDDALLMHTAVVLQELRTMHHLLSNQLTMAAGYAELLQMSPVLVPALQSSVTTVIEQTFAAVGTLRQAQALTQSL